mgnify:CR=1 FL=1
MRFYAGIDPGATGGIAVVSALLEEAHAWLYPGDVSQAADLLREVWADYKPVLCALEHVRAMPGQGVVSMFSFGANYGEWRGMLAALALPWIEVTPQVWQRKCLDPGEKGTSKARSLEMARRLFPGVDLHRKKDHGLADALHLARYAAAEMGCGRAVEKAGET